MDCLFCKMASGVIRPDIVHEDDQVLAFRDIAPQAPVHWLLKTHHCSPTCCSPHKNWRATSGLPPTATGWSTTAIATAARRSITCISTCWVAATSVGRRAEPR
jgi:hypothetical protein